jgi:hypothetical protein
VPAAQASALRQVDEPCIVVTANRELDHAHPAEPAVQRADQRQQILIVARSPGDSCIAVGRPCAILELIGAVT